MKKVSGLVLLLTVCFLFSMQLAAEPYGASNGIALGAVLVESKIVVEEEVATVSRGETMTLLVKLTEAVVFSFLIIGVVGLAVTAKYRYINNYMPDGTMDKSLFTFGI
jgi:hypothetical protein